MQNITARHREIYRPSGETHKPQQQVFTFSLNINKFALYTFFPQSQVKRDARWKRYRTTSNISASFLIRDALSSRALVTDARLAMTNGAPFSHYKLYMFAGLTHINIYEETHKGHKENAKGLCEGETHRTQRNGKKSRRI